MANRKRSISKQFFVNEEEEKMINEKMQQLGTKNFGAYARKMLIDGYVIKTDYTTIKNLIKEVNKIGVNINQVAKKVNETNRIYDEDIKELKGDLEQVWQLLKSSLSNQP
ncbi:MAG: plasmid mobilization relaxosome protein MobC [Clostridium sp.]|uniref:plasmid mobilization protein n=1 Tax=Clostridium sp. TaxID=1506 RepID=UPI002A915C16|nr:plasmid mobilization relaxosome protein MobC [Clostridium sp.]MDY6228794.1 plasmid mobilization relaxosome protein MobC [Clostridium sp.]